ncbi:MAG: glycoside hydrolase family 36 protein [Massiliimalia sp.]|jgi:alpha-galactosidase
MSTKILYSNEKMDVEYRVNDQLQLQLIDFSPKGRGKKIALDDSRSFAPVFIRCTGRDSSAHRSYKHDAGNVALYYDEREEYQNNLGKKVEFKLSSDDGVEVVYHIQFFTGIAMVRSWSTVTNHTKEDLGLEQVSSFVYYGLCKNGELPFYEKTDVYLPQNSWYCEAQWKKFDIEDLGINRMLHTGNCAPGESYYRYSYGNYGSWSTNEFLPMGYVHDRETGETYFWQIESSCGWNAEYSTQEPNTLYASLCGPTEAEGHWWKNLKPGESFTTVPAAFGVVQGGISEATGELTRYRRAIRRLNQDDLKLNVVFNDYMNCLYGDPTEEKEKKIIDIAASLGCEYYCIDAGWYDKGHWWNRVGEWKESPERFPNGLKAVLDYAHSKGMKTGLWIEMEVMGVACPLSSDLPDSWFFQRHGKRHVERERYLLDFRNPEVRAYLNSVFDRLINDYGVEFFKVDYNDTTGFGTDYQSDSCGDGLLEHVRCLHQWYRELYDRYPNLVIENCGSGGQRMDYGMLSLQSLQSTSDQTDVVWNAHIAANVASAVTPEQAGMWVYPYEDNREHVILNMVNGLLLRPYVSGQVWNLCESSLDLMREGISLYKQIRAQVRDGLPFFPLGFVQVKDPVAAYGLDCGKTIYLSAFGLEQDHMSIPLNLKGAVESVKVIYPSTEDCQYTLEDQTLHITFPQTKCARLFEIKLSSLDS